MIRNFTRWSTQNVSRSRHAPIALLLSSLGAVPVWAQITTSDDPHAGHNMPAAEASAEHNHEIAEDSSTNHEAMDHESIAMASMDGESMSMGSMQGGAAPADARDPHAYAGGQDFGPYRLHLGDTQSFTSLLLENFEVAHSNGNTTGAYDLQSSYGRTYDRAVLKAEGDIDGGRIEDARSELLWGHAVTAYWDTQLGLRYDSGDGPDRRWLAFGVQGLAPYWFEVEAAGYLGENGRTALRLDVSYELLFTQKLILQPRLEADIYGKNDTANGLGSGLAEVGAQLRLRYELRREFAPYIGVEWVRKFGKTKDLSRAAGEDASDVRVIAGLRYWF